MEKFIESSYNFWNSFFDFVAPDDAILPGNLAQVKIYLKPETCGMWLWRTVNDVFELGLFL